MNIQFVSTQIDSLRKGDQFKIYGTGKIFTCLDDAVVKNRITAMLHYRDADGLEYTDTTLRRVDCVWCKVRS